MTSDSLFAFREFYDSMLKLGNCICSYLNHDETTLETCIHVFLPLYVWSE